MPPQSLAARLADVIIRGEYSESSLHDLIDARRSDGYPWPVVAKAVSKALGVEVSTETVRRWSTDR